MTLLITTIVLIAILTLAIIMARNDHDAVELVGIFIVPFAIFLFILHTCGAVGVSYRHHSTVAERLAYQTTLDIARETDKTFETAGIVQIITKWNADLAKAKVRDTHVIFGQYVDGRIQEIEPIR